MACFSRVTVSWPKPCRSLFGSGGLMSYRTPRWFPLVVIAGFAVAACSDDGNDAASGTGSTVESASPTTISVPTVVQTTSPAAVETTAGATTVAELTGEPIKLMVIHEVNDGAANPEVTDGAQAAAQAIN